MPFLLPATCALVSDAIVLFLSQLSSFQHANEDETLPNVYRVAYLVPLALLRVGLLLIPLLFYSYTGTALRYKRCYITFYGVGFGVVLVHVLSLLAANPESLESLFPHFDSSSTGGSFSMPHYHWLRRAWYMLLLSLLSTACHGILVLHVQSTAPNPRQSMAYFAVRTSNSMNRTATNSNQQQQHSGISEPAVLQAMNEFMGDLQQRLQRAKSEWSMRLEDFGIHGSESNIGSERTLNHNSSSHGSGLLLTPTRLTPFRVLLNLFAYKDVLDNGQLDAVFEDDATALTHLCPQLLGYLLHGAYGTSSSAKLEQWILNKCSVNLHFAHQCYWFLRAWCLQVPTPSILPGGLGTPLSMSRSNSALSVGGSDYMVGGGEETSSVLTPTPFLDQPASPQKGLECWNTTNASTTKDSGDMSNRRSSSKLFPGERLLITALMGRVQEHGQIPALRLEQGANTSSQPSPPTPTQKQLAMENGWIPIDPASNQPSIHHLNSLNAQQYFSTNSWTAAASTTSTAGTMTNHFDATPNFLDTLLHLAESLFAVKRDDRKAELRRALTCMECEWLPSNCLYLPIGNSHHKVWRIAVDESFPIHTKERVPCIICFEVLDNVPLVSATKTSDSVPSPRSNWFRKTSSDGASVSLPTASTEQPILERASSLEHGATQDVSEADLIQAWRYGERDPYRRASVLHRVTQAYKVPLEKVKTTMDAAFRDRTVSDELQSLTLSNQLQHDAKEKECDTTETTVSLAGISTAFDNGNSTKMSHSALSRTSSGASLVSMGQWSSPRKFTNISPKDDEIGSSLPYGSNHDEDNEITRSVRALIEGSNISNDVMPGSGDVEEAEVPKKKPAVVFRESWQAKQERVRNNSAFGQHPGWGLLPILVKANDDLRQEQLASQLIYRMAAILARERVQVWLCPYEIIALTDTAGIIEAIPDTISIDSLKRNDPNYSGLGDFFRTHFEEGKELANAEANFVESLAAYSVVCFLLQLKDRHNGNILLDNLGHVIHIDFGFFFLSSPGKNAGFESAPFKLTRDFCQVMGGPDSRLFRTFRELCVKTFITLRKHCMEIILLVEMLKNGNEELPCFCGRPDEAIQGLRDRFRLDLNDRACKEYMQSLIDDSIENWRTDWYDRYQRYFVGVL